MDAPAGSSPLVAVVDEIPASRYGVTTALRDHGVRSAGVRTVSDVASGCKVAVLTVRSEATDASTIAACLRIHPKILVIAIVDDDNTDRHLQALGAGAISVVGAKEPVDQIVEAVAAALRGYALLPTAITATLIARQRPVAGEPQLSPAQLDWLRKLSRGSSVSQLARQCSYSERDMYRRLRLLYRELGVASRSEALVLAARCGIV